MINWKINTANSQIILDEYFPIFDGQIVHVSFNDLKKTSNIWVLRPELGNICKLHFEAVKLYAANIKHVDIVSLFLINKIQNLSQNAQWPNSYESPFSKLLNTSLSSEIASRYTLYHRQDPNLLIAEIGGAMDSVVTILFENMYLSIDEL